MQLYRNWLNWYWMVTGGPSGQVFSSSRASYVPTSDAGYQAFLASGNQPTVAVSEADLIATLAVRAPGLVVLTQLGLSTYANQTQWALAIGGYLAKTAAGVQIPFATDQQSLSLMTGMAVRFMQPSGAPASTQWQVGPTTWVTIAAADFLTVAAQVADFVDATFTTLNSVLAAIQSATITTAAQVVTPPSGVTPWPAATHA